MKSLVAIVIALSTFYTGSVFADDHVCRDNYTGEFPGTLLISMQNHIIQKIWYAETVKVGEPVYKEIRSLIPDPANKYSKGGSVYKVEILTSKGLITGKLSVNSFGDELTIESDYSEFTLSCE